MSGAIDRCFFKARLPPFVKDNPAELKFRTSAVGCVNGDVLDVFPGAQLFLSGSMYMGTATENSDGDVVVVLPKAGKDGGKARLEKLVGRFTDRSNVYSRVKHIEAGDPPLIKVVIRLAAVDKEAPEDSVFEVDIAYGFCTDTTPPHDIEAGILHEDFRRLLAKVHVRPGMKINVLAAVISNHHLINQLEAAGVLELWRELVLLLREWCRVRSLDQGVFGGLRPVTIGIVAALVLLRMVTDQVDLSGPDCYEVMMRHALEYVVNIVIRVKDKTEQSPPVLLRVLLTQQDKEDLRRQQRDQALTVADFTGRSNTTHGVSYGTRACLGTHARADAERLGEGRGASIFDWSSNLSTISVFVLTTVQMGFVLATRVVYQSSAHQTAAVVPHEVTAGVTYTAKQTSRALDDLLKARGGITEHQPHTKIYAISPSGHQCEPKHTDETTTSFGLFHRVVTNGDWSRNKERRLRTALYARMADIQQGCVKRGLAKNALTVSWYVVGPSDVTHQPQGTVMMTLQELRSEKRGAADGDNPTNRKKKKGETGQQ